MGAARPAIAQQTSKPIKRRLTSVSPKPKAIHRVFAGGAQLSVLPPQIIKVPRGGARERARRGGGQRTRADLAVLST